MKKALIAGAASVALAAMPVVGAFAATSSSFTDSLKVNVEGGCTLQNSQDASTPGIYTNSDREFTADIAAGNVGYLNGTASGPSTDEGSVTVTCNTGSTDETVWTVSVEITGLTANGVTIPGGAATAGAATSSWAIQSNANGTTASNPFSAYAAAANGTFLTAKANSAVTFNPSYRVYIAADQTPGEYTGSAKYTIELPQQP